jgi:type III pantothenate kinase
MDLIAIDIGNSSIAMGFFTNGDLVETAYISFENIEEFPKHLVSFRNKCGTQAFGARTVPVVVSSVNEPVFKAVEQGILETIDQSALLIGREIPLNYKMAIENPETIGTDRVVNAVAAFEVVGRGVCVADFGTATTIDLVNDLGIFLGGVILPGLGISADLLHQNTSQLDKINIIEPEGSYGTNTTQAINNGIVYGAVGALREMTEQYASKLGYWPQVVVTGGYAKLVAQHCDFVDSVVPDLCLNGLYLVYKNYKTQITNTFEDDELTPEDLLGDNDDA